MSAVAIVVIVAVLVMGIGSFVAAGVFGLMMMEAVDRRKPDLDLYSAFSSFNRRFDRRLQIYRQYRSLCPNGRLHIYEWTSFGLGMACMITLAILISLASPAIE